MNLYSFLTNLRDILPAVLASTDNTQKLTLFTKQVSKNVRVQTIKLHIKWQFKNLDKIIVVYYVNMSTIGLILLMKIGSSYS